MSRGLSFQVSGMHCPACEFLVADEVGRDPGVASARAALVDHRLHVEMVPGDPVDEGALKARWNAVLDPLGYRLFLETEDPSRVTRWETWAGLGWGGAVLLLFLGLQATGVIDLWAPESLGPGGAFLLGLLASVSSCFALVGGLLVSYTAAVGRTNPAAVGPGLTAFHLARLAVFALGGGLLGWAGSALGAVPDLQRLLVTLASLVMAGLGLNLVGVKLPVVPRKMARVDRVRGLASWGTVAGGALLGALTFILPCGFTQSVQFQALATETFVDGALLTLAFALGTFPVLGSVGWLFNTGLNGARRAILLKAGGTVVLGLGLFQLWGALHLWGLRF